MSLLSLCVHLFVCFVSWSFKWMMSVSQVFSVISISCTKLPTSVTDCCSHEAMSDLIALMGSLVDNKGRILVPDIYDSVKPLTDEETSSYDSIDFDMASISLWIIASYNSMTCVLWRYHSLLLLAQSSHF